MVTPRVYRTEAIVLKRLNLGEADRLLTLYTPHLGKIRAVAKGVRRPQSHLAGHVELLTHSTLLLARGQNLDIVTQAETLHSFQSLRQDLWRTVCSLYLAELAERFTPEHLGNYAIFRLLLETLGELDGGGPTELALRYFEFQLLNALGYRPQLHQCVACHATLAPEANFFSPSGGGVLCPRCSQAEPVVRPLSLAALKVMRLLQEGDYATACRLRLKRALLDELERVTRDYIVYLLEHPLHSGALLDALRPGGEPRAARQGFGSPS